MSDISEITISFYYNRYKYAKDIAEELLKIFFNPDAPWTMTPHYVNKIKPKSLDMPDDEYEYIIDDIKYNGYQYLISFPIPGRDIVSLIRMRQILDNVSVYLHPLPGHPLSSQANSRLLAILLLNYFQTHHNSLIPQMKISGL